MNATKFDPARLPEPDSLGFFIHPDVPGEEEDDDVAALLDAMGFKSSFVSFAYDGKDEDADLWFFKGDPLSSEEMKSIMARWTPTPPSSEGWILAGKFDCEDGPHALFVRAKQPERPHANELRRYAQKLDGAPCTGDTRTVMRLAAAYIEDLELRLRDAEARVTARIDESVEAEREACAKICTSEGVTEDECMAGQMFAREIYARNQPPRGGDSNAG